MKTLFLFLALAFLVQAKASPEEELKDDSEEITEPEAQMEGGTCDTEKILPLPVALMLVVVRAGISSNQQVTDRQAMRISRQRGIA